VTDEAAVPLTPDAEPSETLTAPAGGKPPMPAMRVPKHGRGKLLVAGKPGNAGGGRLATQVLEDLVLVGGLTATEMLGRLQDDKRRARISDENLARWLSALAPYLWPRKYEHAGPQGGPILLELEAVRKAASTSFRERLHRVLQGPGGEPPPPVPELPRGVATVPPL